ncbi:MAG: hypothetical protein IKT38_01825 [Clostridia bacterium]|nr:hypothetical protein [Clostridia bacterium]
MKLTTISPRTTIATKYTAIFSLVERILLIGMVALPYIYYFLKCPLEDANPNIIAAVAFSFTIILFICTYSLFRNQNLLLQVVFPKASGWNKVSLYILMLLFPIGEIYFLYNKISKKIVYAYIQYPRTLISPADVRLSSIDSLDYWFLNDYETYRPEIVEMGTKGLTAITNFINKNSCFTCSVDNEKLIIQANNRTFTVDFAFEEFRLETIIEEAITFDLPKGWICNGNSRTAQYTKEFGNENDSDLDTMAEDIILVIKNFEKLSKHK